MHVSILHANIGYKWLKSPFLMIILFIIFSLSIFMTLGLTAYIFAFMALLGWSKRDVYRVQGPHDGKYTYYYDPIYALLSTIHPKYYFCSFFANHHLIFVKNKELHTKLANIKEITEATKPSITHYEKSYEKYIVDAPYSEKKPIPVDLEKLYKKYMVSFVGTSVAEEFAEQYFGKATKQADKSFLDTLKEKKTLIVEKDGLFVVIHHHDEGIDVPAGVIKKSSHDLAVFTIRHNYENRSDDHSEKVIIY